MTLKNSMLSFGLLLAIGFSSWLILMSNNFRHSHAQQDQHLPDAFMEGVVAVIMNKQGTPSMKIMTPKMTHFASDDTTQIEKPTIIVYRDSPNPWIINSDFAKTTQGTSQINFWNNVVIHHDADKDNPTTTMQTTALSVFPDKQTAETNQAVTIKQPDTTVHAIGMLANMNDGTIKLLSQAQGEYVPTS